MKDSFAVDIAEMKARGYDPSTILETVADAERRGEQCATAQQQVIAAASAILRGEMGIIEGSRLLCSLRSRVSSSDHDFDFVPFVVIDDATDHLPIGDVRRHWAADALVRKDLEIQAAEALYRVDAVAGCERLLIRFGTQPNDQTRNV
ncbi:MAG: DUF2489 domain-containing protein [Pyrinomonadaceae bacterium]|nr:DUF2489 domain-containing protein [Pyrinomonadaceae bacterium]